MLVLTRKPGEAIQIGDDIRITVVEVDGGNVKIGIEAPRKVSIHREEVYRRILEENRAASEGTDAGLAGFADIFKKKQGGKNSG